MTLVSVGIVDVAQGTENLGQVVDDEPVAAGEHPAADLLELPSGHIAVDTVQEGRIVVLLGQLLKQVGVFEHVGHGVGGVANEHH